MRIIRHASRFGVLSMLAAVTLVGCTTDRVPSAPEFDAPAIASVQRAAIPGLLASRADKQPATWSVDGVRREHALAKDVTVQAVIGPRGGSLEIPEAGFTLVVPRGAVTSATRFSVTALAGDLLAYEFGPSGSVFPIPLEGTQDMRATNVRKLPRHAELRLGYFVTPSDVDATSHRAAVAQEQTVEVLGGGQRLGFQIPHFSGWIILWRDGTPVDSTQSRR